VATAAAGRAQRGRSAVRSQAFSQYGAVDAGALVPERIAGSGEARKDLLLFGAGEPVRAAGPEAVAVNAHQRFMARQAAQMDAYRRLAEQVADAALDPRSRVRAFVTVNDELSRAFDGLIKQAEITEVIYYDDGSVTVRAELPVAGLIRGLKHLHKDVYSGGRWTTHDFDRLRQTLGEKLVAVGGGAVRQTLALQQEAETEPEAPQPTQSTQAEPTEPTQADSEPVTAVAEGPSAPTTPATATSPATPATATSPDGSPDAQPKPTPTAAESASLADANTATRPAPQDAQRPVRRPSPPPPQAPVLASPSQRAPLPPIFAQSPPNQRLMARRAAELDAYRQLLERILGLQVQVETRVQDYVTADDRILARASGLLWGAQVRDVRYHNDGTVAVLMQLTGRNARHVAQRLAPHADWHAQPDQAQRHLPALLSVVGTGSVDPRTRLEQGRQRAHSKLQGRPIRILDVERPGTQPASARP